MLAINNFAVAERVDFKIDNLFQYSLLQAPVIHERLILSRLGLYIIIVQNLIQHSQMIPMFLSWIVFVTTFQRSKVAVLSNLFKWAARCGMICHRVSEKWTPPVSSRSP